MNNSEREMWVLNDEGLYSWWRSTHQSMTQFLKDNRKELDLHIKGRA